MERWRITLYSIWFTQIISIMSFSLGMPFMVYYIQQLGMTDPEQIKLMAGILTAGPSITMAIMAPIWGRLADRYGKKLMVLRALMAGSLVMFGLGLSNHVWQLVVLRMAQGMFTGTITASMALVASTVPEKRMGYALGFMASSTAIGSSLGPALGGLLAEWMGYRYSFLLGGVLLFLDVLVVTFLVQDVREPSLGAEHALSVTDASNHDVTLGAACAVSVTDDSSHTATTDPAAHAARPDVLPAARKSRLRDTFVFAPWFLSAMAILLVHRFSTSIFGPYMPILVQTKLGSLEGAAATTGLINAFISAMMAASGILLGKLGDKYDRIRLMRLYAAIGCILAVPLFLVGSRGSIWMLMANYGVMMFFVCGIEPVLLGATTNRIRREQRGTLFGVQALIGSIGWGMSPMLGGLLSIRISLYAVLAAIPALLLVEWMLARTVGRSLATPAKEGALAAEAVHAGALALQESETER